MYQHPGVYIEEIPSSSRPIESASTSTALIVGYATKGPVGDPTFILSYDQYVKVFGGINDFHARTDVKVDHMGHGVKAFFQNGGSKAYIVRLLGTGDKVATAKLPIPPAGAVTKGLHFKARNPGVWANDLKIQVTAIASPPGKPQQYNVEIGYSDRDGKLKAQETYVGVTLDPSDAVNFVGTHINNISALVNLDPSLPSPLTVAEKGTYSSIMVGSLTSGDLSTLTDMSVLNSKSLKIGVKNPSESTTISFTATSFDVTSTLADVASYIQNSVRTAVSTPATPATDPRQEFICLAANGRLILQSGINGESAAVALGLPAPTSDCSATLKLDTGNAQSQTGDQAFLATFSTSSFVILANGADGALPMSSEYDDADLFAKLRKIRDINIMLLPGLGWKSSGPHNASIDAFKAHAERMKSSMLIIDPQQEINLTTSNSFLSHGFPTSTYTCTYYPWVEVANPHYHPDLRPDRAKTVMVAPSGFSAGVWARTDSRRGVWKAPAGLQASITGISRTAVKIGDDEQDQLNPVGVNCLRQIISDHVVWGARTLATKTDPEWRYLPVRRTAMMIEESIYQGIQWAVFEPNDHKLWGSLRLNIENFMNGLFRAGAFQGEKASDAYFVRCGLNDTMTQADIDLGQVIVLVGFAPVKPAEFVIVRLQQIVGRQ